MRNAHYLIWIYSIVDWPGCLEIFEHPLLELLGQVMNTYEVLQILSSSVIEGPSGIHPLYDRRHISKHQGMHQGWRERHNVSGREIWWKSSPLQSKHIYSLYILNQSRVRLCGHADTAILVQAFWCSHFATGCILIQSFWFHMAWAQ